MRTAEERLAAFSAVFPLLMEAELAAAHEAFGRYVAAAMEIAVVARTTASEDGDLTIVKSGGTVSSGTVDPRSFTTTG